VMPELEVHIIQTFDPQAGWVKPGYRRSFFDHQRDLCGNWQALAKAPGRHHSRETARNSTKDPFEIAQGQ
jgi:hypothetical protein